MRNVLSEIEIEKKVQNIPDWKYTENTLKKTFIFKNFTQTLAFIVQVGFCAEQLNHHPEIINTYNKVTLRLSTHQPKGITDLDFLLLEKINEI